MYRGVAAVRIAASIAASAFKCPTRFTQRLPCASNAHDRVSYATASTPPPSPLLGHIYEPFPRPFNCTTFHQTRIFASDPSHPYYIKIQRKIQAFDPQNFIWVVRCPMDVSKRAAHRHQVQKKVRKAFIRELWRRGYAEDGTILSAQGENGEGSEEIRRDVERPNEPLSGALVMYLNKDKERTLLAKSEEINESVRVVLAKVVQKHKAQKLRSRSDLWSEDGGAQRRLQEDKAWEWKEKTTETAVNTGFGHLNAKW